MTDMDGVTATKEAPTERPGATFSTLQRERLLYSPVLPSAFSGPGTDSSGVFCNACGTGSVVAGVGVPIMIMGINSRSFWFFPIFFFFWCFPYLGCVAFQQIRFVLIATPFFFNRKRRAGELSFEAGENLEAVADAEAVAGLFPSTYGQPFLAMKR